MAEPKDASLMAVTKKYAHVYVLENPLTFLDKQRDIRSGAN